ncbi:hypothetical protein [Bacillus massiliglaciei]|uniref:hypothetical protein n=1 Tax=Bacillus massiliglaciei TaxID=1816693 RepID=UPI000A43849F|nr:hypothetical protein [Bacillus massiliglaciei]
MVKLFSISADILSEYILGRVAMEEQRKKIIMQEIQYWKESKMLPGHYCDFLFALYSGGDKLEENEEQPEDRRTAKMLLLSGMAALLLANLVLNYFTEVNRVLQIGFPLISVLIIIWLGFRYFKNSLLFQFAMVFAALLMLVSSVKITDILFSESLYAADYIVMGQCAVWMIIGKKYKFTYFLIGGSAGMLLVLYQLAKLYFI